MKSVEVRQVINNGRVVATLRIVDGILKKCIETDNKSFSIPGVALKDIKTIAAQAFRGCHAVSITMPNSIIDIGWGAFYDCVMLRNIEIPDSVNRIGESAFRGCSALTSIAMSCRITSIQDSALLGCESLKHLQLPSTVISIQSHALRQCQSLTSICFSPSLKTIG